MEAQTPTEKLADIRLGQPLLTWVAARRAEGLSWIAISERLADATNGEIAISKEFLRLRFADIPRRLRSRRAS